MFCFSYRFSIGCLHAQQTASIAGQLYDTSHAALGTVRVTLRNTASNATRAAVADAQGQFSFQLLPAGTYELQAEKQGFKTSLRQTFGSLLGNRHCWI